MARSHAAPNTVRARLSPARLSAERVARRGIQIGPRIRVGGTLGAIGQSVKTGVGKVASAAAPVVSFFNPGIGAALAVGGRALDTTNGGSSLGDLAMAGAKTYGLGKVAGPLVRAIPGVGGLGDKLGGLAKGLPGVGGIMGSGGSGAAPGGGVGGVADASTVMTPSGGGTPWDQILGSITGNGGASGEASGGGIDWGSILGNIGGFVQDHGTDLAAGGLATAQALAAAKASQRAGTLQDKALGLAESNWSAGEPLRTQGRTRLLSPVRPDLTSTYTDPTNPFARVRRTA